MTSVDTRTSRGTAAALTLLCLLGLGLRLVDIDWDQGHHLHPDERYWSFVTDDVSAPESLRDYLDAETSPFNPYATRDTWVYGTWPVGLTKATATWLAEDGAVAGSLTRGLDALGVDLRNDEDRPRFDAGYDANLIGRLLSALFDTGTIGLVYALARRLGGSPLAGLFAAGFQAFAVLPIQYSHFYGAETLAACTTTAAVLVSVRIARRGATTRAILAVGALAGLAIAAKISTAPVLVAPTVAILVDHMRRSAPMTERLRAGVTDLALLGLSAVAVVKLTLPYAFDQWWGLRIGPRYLDDLDYLAGVNGGTFNVPWTIQWIGRSRLLGPLGTAFWWGLGPALAIAVLAGLVVAVRRLRRGEWWWLVPLAFVAVQILSVSRQFNGLIRYLLPAYPVAIAMAGVAMARLVVLAGAADLGRWPRRVAGATVFACVVGTALWGLAFTNGVYGNEHSRIEATEWITENVAPRSAVSHSIWDDVLPLPTPEAQALGLRVVDLELFANDTPAKVESLIAGLDQVDYVIESSNRLYDSVGRFPARYPVTTAYYDALFAGRLGFREVARFTNEPSLFGITIDDAHAEETFTVYDHPTVIIWQKTDAWSTTSARRVLDPDRAANSFDTEHRRAGANALQLTPDDYRTQQAGGTFAEVFDPDGPTASVPWLWWLLWLEIAGLAAVPWTTWLFGRVAARGYAFSKIAGLLAATIPLWFLIATGTVRHTGTAAWISLAIVVVVGAVVGARRRETLRAHWRLHRRSWLASEAVFLVSFGAVLMFSIANPDLWHPFVGGEKPMEVAYFTAVTRSTTLPAYDPWFAGGAMNYYYLGWFILSVPTKALGIVPEVAFNLGLPTMAAMAATALFGVGQTIAGAFERRRPSVPLVPGLLAAGAVLAIGNVEGALQWLRHPDVRYDWWAPSRVNDGLFDITEFPFWSLLFGDVHPHVLDIGVLAVVIGLAVAYTVTARAGDRNRRLALAVALGATTGVVRMVHTWDLPVAVLVTLVAVVGGELLGPGRLDRRLARLATSAVVIALTHVVLTAPYRAHIEVFDGGLERADEVTATGDFLSQFGLFVAVAVGYGVARARQLGLRRVPDGGPAVALVAVSVGVVALTTTGIGATFGLCAAATIAFAAIVVVGRRDLGHSAVAALYALGFATAGGVEIVTVVNDIERLNTVFKFWYQAWQLLAIASAVAAWWLVPRAAELVQRGTPRKRAVALGWTMAVFALATATLVYPVLAPGVRLDERFAGSDQITGAGLDGLAYLAADPVLVIDGVPVAIGDDLALIEWLRENVEGTPTIVEATGPLYSWTARISVTTGLPTVIGWDWHQIQQRRDYAGAVATRKADVEAFYRSPEPDVVSRVLRTYDVSYVVVGTLEHLTGDPTALAALGFHPALVEVFTDGNNAIYRVDRDALDREYA